MKILASYNIKGGVGKTATVVNLACLAAEEGANTLVWDLDPQGAASFYFRVKAKIKGGNKKLIKGNSDAQDLIKGTDYPNLDLLPADFSYRNMDLVLEASKKPDRQLNKILMPLRDEYDYVFLDCPPSISLVSENVFNATDALLIPTIPTTLSLRTLGQLMVFLRKKELNSITLLPFFSMVDKRKNLHRQIVQGLPQSNTAILKKVIPYAAEIEKMGTHRAAVTTFAGHSPSAKAYSELWDEIKTRLNR